MRKKRVLDVFSIMRRMRRVSPLDLLARKMGLEKDEEKDEIWESDGAELLEYLGPFQSAASPPYVMILGEKSIKTNDRAEIARLIRRNEKYYCSWNSNDDLVVLKKL